MYGRYGSVYIFTVYIVVLIEETGYDQRYKKGKIFSPDLTVTYLFLFY